MNPDVIEAGDIVEIHFTDTSGYEDVMRDAVVIHPAVATGDMWRLRSRTGMLVYVNSGSSDLTCIVLKQKKEAAHGG